MEYVVTTGQTQINFAPKTVVEEVLQNVRCILRTTKFSVPLDRDLGIDAEPLDMPEPPNSTASVLSSSEYVPAKGTPIR